MFQCTHFIHTKIRQSTYEKPNEKLKTHGLEHQQWALTIAIASEYHH